MVVSLRVKEIMVKPVTISKSQSIIEALNKMFHEGIDPLIVLSSHQVVGTVSRKSIADKLGSKQKAQIAIAKIHVASSLEENFSSAFPEQNINDLLPLLKKNKIVVVYDKDDHLIGQVGYGELLKVLQPKGGIDKVTEPAHTINVNERLTHLENQMIQHKISRFVVNENEKIIGIVTETDLAVSLIKFREKIEGRHHDFHLHNLLVRSVMTSPIITVDRNVKVTEIIDLMLKKNISSIPVTDQGKLFGIVTRQSLLNAL
ncbi:MAG: CBS domain-containing protein [Methanoregulaceae archaeon]|jgi:CBS domain-containing protein